MTNRKSTKRALLGSVMAMVLCLAMLVGATFAWFTDTASTGVNKIQAGNLDIEIQDENGNAIKNLAWKTQEGTAFDEEQNPLWEPGCTYELTPFQIVNKGNLALKYKIVLTGLEGDSGLLKVITFTYKTADGATFDIHQEGHLTAKGTAKASTGLITLTGTMDTTAGNDYMGKELKNITITVTATQDTVESDSFSNRYDNAAEYPAKVPTTVTVATAEELKTALTTLTDAGSGNNKVIISEDITLAEGETWTPVTVDGYRGAGVITVEDLLEEIVGNIYDEFDPAQPQELEQLEPDLWRVNGGLNVEDLAKALELDLPQDEDYDTVGGMVLSRLRTIPQDGSTPVVHFYGLELRVERVKDHRIQQILVRKERTSGQGES